MAKATSGNFFEDFRVGMRIRHPVPRTVHGGDLALYIALTGERRALASSTEFAKSLGFARETCPELLAFHVVFGKSVGQISLNAVANLVEHGNIDLPRRVEATIERMLVTPALHRRHHTKTGPERDTNFGTILSIWDRLLGTYPPNDSAAAVETGLPGIEHLGLWGALVLPTRSGRQD